MKHSWILALAATALVVTGDLALSAPAGQGKGPPGNKAQQEARGPKEAKAHKHGHKNGHDLLGAKIKQNGKHEVGKLANRTVTVDVRNGKVSNMAAGDLPMKRVKSKMKMAAIDNGGVIQAAWGGEVLLAQYTDYYYGYCFDDGVDYTCYWYPAEDVDYAAYTWDDYDPYY